MKVRAMSLKEKKFIIGSLISLSLFLVFPFTGWGSGEEKPGSVKKIAEEKGWDDPHSSRGVHPGDR